MEKELNETENKDTEIETLIKEAKDNEHPLHDMFEWDDKVAADAWEVASRGPLQ